MDVLERIGCCGIVPVVVIDKVGDAIPTADALFGGGVDVVEITLRTEAGLGGIREVAEKRKDICIGAGTVVSLEQCRSAVDAGATFIVSPGFSHDVVEWCVKNDVAVIPGCVTPTEIMQALSFGVDVLKFFPANLYGGLFAMKSLSCVFGGVKFIPTGGIGPDNLHEYVSVPFIHAIGGSWICTKNDITNGNFDTITDLTAQAVKIIRNR